MKYLVLAKVSNYVEGKTLRTKNTEDVCKFILKDIFSRYGNNGRAKVDRRKLNAFKATFFSSKIQ